MFSFVIVMIQIYDKLANGYVSVYFGQTSKHDINYSHSHGS